MTSLERILLAEEGVTSLEYALIAGLVALAILVAATALGADVGIMYSNLAAKFPPAS